MIEKLAINEDILVDAPKTEGIKYTGSKLKLIPHILKLIKKTEAKTILDGFAGTTRVSQSLAKSGYSVYCNDTAIWSKTFGTCYLLANKKPYEYKELISHLNNLKPKNGWFTKHYGGHSDTTESDLQDGFKKPWQTKNTRKLDAIREEIDNMKLNAIDKSVALTSLILAMDKVDSTLGHYASYLREWSPRSYNDLILKVPMVFQSENEHRVSHSDVFEFLKTTKVDLAYYDPPYGSNNEKMPPSRVRYASYYHVWATIILNDKPKIVGKAKRRADVSDMLVGSVFEEFRKDENGQFIALGAIKRMLTETDSKWIVLSYSSGGRATAEELNSALRERGELLEIVEINYKKNIMAEMKWTDEWLKDAEQPHREFLFLLKCK